MGIKDTNINSSASSPVITPPSGSLSDRWYVSEDHVDMGMNVTWANWSEDTRPMLAKARDAKLARSLVKSGAIIPLAGVRLEMSRRGKAIGGDDGDFYEYVLTDKEFGMEFLVRDMRGGSPDLLNVRAKLEGRYFLNIGDGRFGYGMIKAVIKALGGSIKDCKLSRVDLAIDLPGVGIDLFLNALDQDCYITKARSTLKYQSGCATLYLGKKTSKIRCCIYDKLCKDGGDTKALPALLMRWGGELLSEAIRVEFRLRREALLWSGIDSVDDLFEKEGDLLNYLTTDWLRFTDRPVDRKNKNQARAKTLPLWQAISDRFVTGAGNLSGKPLAPVPPAPINVEHRAKGIVGSVLSMAKGTGTSLPNIEAFNSYALGVMEPYARERLPLVCRK
jgi:hypothetical protein